MGIFIRTLLLFMESFFLLSRLKGLLLAVIENPHRRNARNLLTIQSKVYRFINVILPGWNYSEKIFPYSAIYEPAGTGTS